MFACLFIHLGKKQSNHTTRRRNTAHTHTHTPLCFNGALQRQVYADLFGWCRVAKRSEFRIIKASKDRSLAVSHGFSMPIGFSRSSLCNFSPNRCHQQQVTTLKPVGFETGRQKFLSRVETGTGASEGSFEAPKRPLSMENGYYRANTFQAPRC